MSIRNLESILRDHPFFREMPRQHLERLAGCASNEKFSPGEYLCRRGGMADKFYVLREGQVAVEINVPDCGSMMIQVLEDTEVVGWSWLFPPFTWNFDARSISQTRVIAMDAKCLRAKCEADHDLGYDLLKRFSSLMLARMQAMQVQLMDLYNSPTENT